MASFVHLDEASVEALAQRVAELLRGERISPELIDAAEVGRRFSVSRDYVYAHAEELGAIRLGTGERARLRFDLARVTEAFAGAEEEQVHPPATSRKGRRSRSEVDLLPVGPSR